VRTIQDFKGRSIRLTEERITHFIKRLTKAGLFEKLEEAIANPDFVIESVSDPSASISYRYYRGTKAGNKYLCVVVKYATSDAYVLTGYPSDEVKKGRIIWERNKK
jgi:phage-Barnase-EndoU-ColicinE5/D-RelE like nuclease2